MSFLIASLGDGVGFLFFALFLLIPPCCRINLRLRLSCAGDKGIESSSISPSSTSQPPLARRCRRALTATSAETTCLWSKYLKSCYMPRRVAISSTRSSLFIVSCALSISVQRREWPPPTRSSMRTDCERVIFFVLRYSAAATSDGLTTESGS